MDLIPNRRRWLELYRFADRLCLDALPAQTETVADDKCREIGNTIAVAQA